MVKENEWVGRNVDLKLLSQRIRKFFEDDGFHQIRSEEDPNGSWYEIQAMKTGVLRTLVSSRKAIHIVIKGQPNKFEVEMGVGEWGKNIGVAAFLTGGIGLIGLGFDVRFQNKLWNFIKSSVDSLSNSKGVVLQETHILQDNMLGAKPENSGNTIFEAQYVGGHKFHPMSRNVRITLLDNYIDVSGIDIQIPYKEVYNIENADEKKISAMRVDPLGVIGELLKKNYAYTVIQYRDGFGNDQSIVLDFDKKIEEAPSLIYNKIQEYKQFSKRT